MCTTRATFCKYTRILSNMDSAPYNNRELDSKFSAVLDKLDSLGKDLEHHRQHLHEGMDEFEAGATIKLDDIKTQTTKTNGRVSTLERWQAYVLGSTATLMALLVPIVIYMATKTLA